MSQNTSNIDGVIITPLKRFPDERGTVMHGVRAENLLSDFGEIYFKKLYMGVINGWHIHEELTLNYMVISGMIKLVLYDVRKDSSTHGQLQEIFYGDDNYCMVHIPPGIANGSKGMTDPHAIMCNVASHAHDPKLKYQRIDPDSDEIPYDWARKNF